ncbi:MULTISPECIES: biotin transporter BioY [Actinoallomurus]|uniref:biotin transporter BioY n=1 Tax=Actinoallomurus TaxID=667113 RepID=UPI002091F389|nr:MULTISPECIES: biotin transporter BioY [Actinoallomurus]MCO5970000.1 biotin transporter BioY [Actinoallomurus soli]MCO5994898.1 biotin transporter BioY [Actinoallomurus rhizosphaericola]
MSNSQAVATRPAVLGDLVPGRLVRDVALVVGAAVFVGLAAQVSVPIPGTPVPVTGQTFAVLLSGAALGFRRGALSMALYTLAGMVGVPWFSDGTSGWRMASFGYILGFVLAGAVVGALAARGGDRSPVRTVGTMALGLAVIYAVGVPWLMAWTHSGLGQALSMGVRPFLVGDAIKIALAAGLLPGAWRLLRR